jgi:hypothetical protein
MDDAAFAPGAPEVELDARDGLPVHVDGERGRMGRVVLTNERILLTDTVAGTGSVLGELVAAGVEARRQKAAGGPTEIARITELRAGRTQQRRLLPDLYELTLADGSTCRTHRKLRKKWDTTIQRLLTERHGFAVTADEATGGWRAAPPTT